MRTGRGPVLAAGAYLLTAPIAMRLAIRDHLVAEPLGIVMGRASVVDALLTSGTALSAPPWMLVALAWHMRGASRGERRSVAVLAALGASFTTGMLIEPAGREALRWPSRRPGRTAIVIANLVIPATLALTALRQLTKSDGSESE